jgi:hypothetical protein
VLRVDARTPDPNLIVNRGVNFDGTIKNRITPGQKLPDKATLISTVRAQMAWTNDIRSSANAQVPVRSRANPSDKSKQEAVGDQRTKNNETGKQKIDAKGWISGISLSGNTASCTVHYYSETEKSALCAQTQQQLNTFLNDKSYVRQEANREAYPELYGQQKGRQWELAK